MNEKPKQTPRMSRRDFLRVAGLTAAGGVLVACAPAAPPPAAAPTAAAAAESTPSTSAPAADKIEVQMMMNGPEFTDAEIDIFQEKNPGIIAARLDPDTTRYFAMLAAGNPPDILRLQAPQFPQLLARKIPLNLQPFVDVSEIVHVDDLAPANNYYRSGGDALEIGDGDVYGMVKDWSPDMTLWANLDLIEEAGLPAPSFDEPMTYQDVRLYAEKLVKFEGDRTVNRGFDTNQPWIERFWMVWLEGMGNSLFSDDFKEMQLVKNDEAREAVAWHFDLSKDKLSISPSNPSPSWFGQDFATGTLGLLQFGFWYSGGIEVWSDDAMKEKVAAGRIVMLPSPTWKGVKRGPTITATGTIVTAATKYPDQAYRLFEWYNAEEAADNRAKSGWGVPALKSKYAMIPKEGAYRSQVWGVLEKELKDAETTVKFNSFLAGGEPGEVASLYAQFMEQALTGDITFDEMLEKIETQTNTAIQDGIDRIL